MSPYTNSDDIPLTNIIKINTDNTKIKIIN